MSTSPAPAVRPGSTRGVDVLAGLAIADLLLPQAVAYSGIAALPPAAGVIALKQPPNLLDLPGLHGNLALLLMTLFTPIGQVQPVAMGAGVVALLLFPCEWARRLPGSLLPTGAINRIPDWSLPVWARKQPCRWVRAISAPRRTRLRSSVSNCIRRQAVELEGMLILWPEEPLFFVNAESVLAPARQRPGAMPAPGGVQPGGIAQSGQHGAGGAG